MCFAAQEDSPNATRLLLEAGADPTLRCCENGLLNQIDSNNDSQHFLLQQTRFSGYTPLHYCAHYNSCKAAIVLLEHNKKLKSQNLFDIQDLNKKCPIHIVAERGSCDVMRELLHNGVRVDCTRMKSSGSNETNYSISTSLESENQNARNQDNVAENAEEMDDDEVEDEQMEEDVNSFEAPSTPNASQNADPISSPILRSLIPSQPRNSPKPWNCLTQNSIDECKLLLQEAECCWAPKRHYIFTPNDRAAIVEVMKVAVRLNHIPHEIWLHIVKFCGRGWFDPDQLTIKS